jgi:RNA polymerase sigma-70 factor (ECF subfamily)
MRLIRKAARGDREAFRTLYLRLHPLVVGYILRRIRVEADAQDLTARVFHRVLERLRDYDQVRGTVRTWVLTIARNTIIDHIRARRPSVAMDEMVALADTSPLPDAMVIRDERMEMVCNLVSEYPPELREMLAMRFGDGLQYREIAELTGSTEAAVKQRFSRTLRDLRVRTKQLEKQGASYAT